MRSGAASTTGSGQSSGGFRKGSCADALLRFRRIPVQIPGEVSEVPVQIPGEVPEGFRCR